MRRRTIRLTCDNLSRPILLSDFQTTSRGVLRPVLIALWSLLFVLAPALGENTSSEASFTEPANTRTTVTEGHLQLAWAGGPDNATYELQQASSQEFSQPRTLYRGPDKGSFVSGLPEGDTWYRVRLIDDAGEPGPWSDPVRIRVNYPSMQMVVILMSAGLAMLVILVTAVLTGAGRGFRKGGSPDA